MTSLQFINHWLWEMEIHCTTVFVINTGSVVPSLQSPPKEHFRLLLNIVQCRTSPGRWNTEVKQIEEFGSKSDLLSLQNDGSSKWSHFMEMYVLAKLPWESLTNLRGEGWSLWRETTAWAQGVGWAECLQTATSTGFLSYCTFLFKKKKKEKAVFTRVQSLKKKNLRSWVWNPKASSLAGLCRESSWHSPSCPEGTGVQDLDGRLPQDSHAECSGFPSPTMYLTLYLLSWTQGWLIEPTFLPFSLNMPA